MTRRVRRVAPIVVLTVVLMAGAACSDPEGDQASASGTSTSAAPTTVAAAGPPLEFTELTREYTDESRPAVDPSGAHSAQTRRLVTTVRVPIGPGPFPLVVFAHGNGGHPRKVTQLLDAWARAGYVVVAPAFPLTNDDSEPTVIADYTEQPADASTVIDGVLDDAAASSNALSGSVDEDQIGVAGHSLGAATMYGVAENTCCLDERVDAVVALSGLRLDFAGGAFGARVLPLLAFHGTTDGAIPYDAGHAGYDAWIGPKSFVTLEGAPHSSPYEDAPSPHDELVAEMTTLFWDTHLRDDEDAAARLSTYALQPELARIESSP